MGVDVVDALIQGVIVKIIKLQAENIKRLTAIEITPDGTMITVGGKNGAGKSSVLDSIAYALGGVTLVPSQPIRNGETEAKIVVDLGDVIVTRRFTRERIDVVVHAGVQGAFTDNDLEKAGQNWTDAPVPATYGPTKSTLTVKNRENASYPSPQAMLDKLLGKLTFDPLQFARADPKDQDVILRKLINLDVKPFDDARKLAAAERAMLKKTHDIKEAQLLALPQHKDVPDTELSIEDISREMADAESTRQAAATADRLVDKLNDVARSIQSACSLTSAKIEAAEKQLAELRAQLAEYVARLNSTTAEVHAAMQHAETAHAAVPDVAVIREKLTTTEATNTKIRANRKHHDLAAEVHDLATQITKHTTAVNDADTKKANALREAHFPVAGLGLNDDGVTFNGVPFEQASTSEQIRVSVAIGLALNPTLRVLLIRNANALDSDSMKAVAEQATAADAQLWLEVVAESKDGVSVMLEDGAVV